MELEWVRKRHFEGNDVLQDVSRVTFRNRAFIEEEAGEYTIHLWEGGQITWREHPVKYASAKEAKAVAVALVRMGVKA